MFEFSDDVLVPFLVFAVPIVAIVGGITAGIVKTISRHRLMEVALRERMALIARGVDPGRLPASHLALDPGVPFLLSLADYDRYRAQGLLIGGFVTLAGGIAFGVFLALVDGREDGAWSLALVPATIGLALLASGLIVRPKRSGAGAAGRAGAA